MRTMYDAVTPGNILKANPHPQMVAGYLNGTYAWSAADWALFPGAVHVGISIRASDHIGHVLDVEPGDATPAESVDWVIARRAAGADPSVYCNASTWPTVVAAFNARGVATPHWWAAKYDGDPTLLPGCVAKQYLGDVAPGIDISSVADYWPGVDTGPAAPTVSATTPATASKGPEIMQPILVKASDSPTSVRVELLTGTATTGLIIRPILNKGGLADNPVFVTNVYAWGADKAGVGGNPAAQPGYNPRLTSAHWVPLPGALWCDVEFACHADFYIQPVG